MLRRRIIACAIVVMTAGVPGRPGASPSRAAAPQDAFRLPAPFASVVNGTDADRNRLARAYELAIRDCMAARGFRYVPSGVLSASPDGDALGDDAYGFVSPGRASQEGYGLTRRPEDDANLRYLRTLDDTARAAWQEAMTGSPSRRERIATVGSDVITADPDGCTSRARLRLYGDRRWVELSYWVQEIANQVVDAVRADARFQHARARWRRCMTRAGYPMTSPRDDGVSYLAAHAPSDQAVEKAVARQDAACLVEADCWRIARELQAAAERARAAAHRDRLTELDRLRRAAVKRAREIEGGR